MQLQEIDADDGTAKRDSRGRLLPGSPALNPRAGQDRKIFALKRKLDGLTERAIARLGRLVESDNETVALGAVREVLDRNLGKAKATVQVDVTQTYQLHLEALVEISERKRNQLLASQVIDGVAVQHDPETGSIIHVMRNAVQHNESGAVDPPVPPSPRGASAVAPTPPHTEEK